MKKAVRIISSLIIIAMLSSSCTVNLSNNKKEVIEEDDYEQRYDVIDKGPVKGGAIRLFTTPIDTLNPVITNNIYVQDFLGLVYEGLFRLDSTQQPVPVLAKNLTVSGDGLTVTVFLRDNVMWHDKMPLKPDDVVFTINTIMDQKNGSVYSANVKYISAVSSGPNNTVIIKLKQPYSFLINELTFPILPVHCFVNEKVNVKNSKPNLNPIGTGPYTYVSYDPKSSVKLKLNEAWWNSSGIIADKQGNRKDGQGISLPYISNVEVKIFKTSAEADTAFQSKDVDTVYLQSGNFSKYVGRTDITMERFPGKNYEFLSLNIKSGPLADKRVRNAINYLIDKKQLVNSAASGIAIPAEIPVLPSSWVYKLTDFDHTFDVNKAKELLIQSGYVYDSGKNKYVNKYSRKPLALDLIVNDDNTLRNNVSNALVAQLAKNGITVVVSKLSWDNEQGKLRSGSYDMALLGYKISSSPDLSFAYSTAEIQSGLNVAKYSNPVVDGYLQQILSQNDIDVQKSIYKNLFNVILYERPYIGLFFLNDSLMYGKNIRGAINPYVWNKYNDFSQWYIPQ